MSEYQYAWQTCGYRFEKFRPADPGVAPECPTCGSHEVKKQHLSTASCAVTASLSVAAYGGG